MHLLPPRTNFLANFLGPNTCSGSSLVGVLIAGSLLTLVSIGVFRGMNQQSKIASSLRQKTKFLQVEQELKSRIRTAMHTTLSSHRCQAKFKNWYQANKKLDTLTPFKLDFSKKAITTLPDPIKTRCMQQYTNRSIKKSLYFCAKLDNHRSSESFVKNYDVYVETKLYYWDNADSKNTGCSWNASTKSLNGASLKYLYSIYWRRKPTQNPQIKHALNFYRGWSVSQL